MFLPRVFPAQTAYAIASAIPRTAITRDDARVYLEIAAVLLAVTLLLVILQLLLDRIQKARGKRR